MSEELERNPCMICGSGSFGNDDPLCQWCLTGGPLGSHATLLDLFAAAIIVGSPSITAREGRCEAAYAMAGVMLEARRKYLSDTTNAYKAARKP